MDFPLRDHPMMSYRGLKNWPPTWTWRGGAENKSPKGEVGVLRKVLLSTVEPRSRLFLVIEHENEEYMGCLLFDNPAFCNQVYEILKQSCGSKLVDVGGLDASHLV